MQTPTKFNSTNRSKPLFKNPLGEIQKNIASAMIGKTVRLMADAKTIASGLVVGVMIETGTPKIVVNGQHYELNQILTVCPAAF